MSKVPISVCIIAKNEERYIEECLRKLKPHGMEIVVADTGSTDKTKEIAMKYADKVLDFEWIDDFSAARNFCAKNASNNWILSIDCDEYLNSINLRDIRIFMQKYPRYTGMIHLINLVSSKKGETYTGDNVVRFYNRNHYRYENPIHEQLVSIKGKESDITQKCFLLPLEAIHHGYNINAEEMEQKQKRNVKILHKSLEKNPNDPYMLFQLGQSEYILQDIDASIEHMKKALEYAPSTDFSYVQILITSLAQIYRDVGRNQEALDLMETYKDSCKTARFVFMHALTLMDSNQILKALLQFLKVVTLPDVASLGENLKYCYENIINIYRRMGENEMADMFVEKFEALKAEKDMLFNS